MRYVFSMTHKVRFHRNNRRRYVKTRRYREQTRSWNTLEQVLSFHSQYKMQVLYHRSFEGE